MWKAKIISKWVSPAKNVVELDAAKFLRKGDSIMDITGQPAPVGAVVVCELWCADPATIDAIMADAGYAKTVLSTVCDDEAVEGELQKTPTKTVEAESVATKTEVDEVKATLAAFGAAAEVGEAVKDGESYAAMTEALRAEIRAAKTAAAVSEL